jgi:hypothetical protein
MHSYEWLNTYVEPSTIISFGGAIVNDTDKIAVLKVLTV